MRKVKNVFTVLFAGLFFAAGTAMLVLMFVGAFEFAKSFINDCEPTVYEYIGIVFVSLLGGAAGAIWALCDLDVETDYEKATFKRLKEEENENKA